MFSNQNPANNGGGSAMDTTQAPQHPQQQQQQQQNVTYNGMQQQQQQQSLGGSKNMRKKPYVKITEQPAGKALRFRYECEGRSAGSIPGLNSTPENKTYPTIEIVGYKGRAVVVVSCVTKDAPYRPHPHNLVGKEGCKKGVCTLEINSETMRAVFSNLGIQCVKKKDIEAALKAREEIRVDPFKTGFSHRYQPSSIDLNSVRLCFQVFMESDQKGRFTQPLPPVVSDPIFDKKAMSDLVICRLCSCSASVVGNTQIILLCEKVAKEDIAVRFFEEKNGHLVWEAFGDFQHTDVHKQTAITFKTPRYHTLDITEPAKVFIQLRRPSDNVTSEALPFEYVPMDSGRHTYWKLRRNLKRKPDLDLFQEILGVDTGRLKPTEVIDLNTPTNEQLEIPVPQVNDATVVVAAQEAEEAAKRRSEHEIDTIIDEKVRELEQQHQQQLLQAQAIDTMPPEQQQQPPDKGAELSANEKINEWMKSNAIEHMDSTSSNETVIANVPHSEEDKTLNDLLEQVAELDEIYTDHVLKRDTYNNALLSELSELDKCVPDAAANDGTHAAMEIDESFDDAATYTSLQIAFKNPVSIPMEDLMPPTPPASQMAPEDVMHYDPIDIIATLQSQLPPSPPRPAPPNVGSPVVHVTAAEEQKLPPLPPKRVRKPDANDENRSIEANTRESSRPPAQIIIMKTPDQSPPTKRLPPKPGNPNYNTLPKQKKPGFFSKLFSRRKSKPDAGQASEHNSLMGSLAATPNMSREPSIRHFELNDPKRRSVKSLQPSSLPTSPSKGSPHKTDKKGKPVGRSVSSVSGKRPAHLDAAVIHIPLKGNSSNSLPQHEAYSNASTITLPLGQTLDRKTVSALQLADIPLNDGNMELVAIADRQSLRNLCQGEFNVRLDPDVDLTEAEHFALYTSIPPQATASEFDETSAYYAAVDAGEILTPDEIARRLAAANRII